MITSFFCLECENTQPLLSETCLVSVQGTRVGYTVVAVASCGDGSVYRTRIRQS